MKTSMSSKNTIIFMALCLSAIVLLLSLSPNIKAIHLSIVTATYQISVDRTNSIQIIERIHQISNQSDWNISDRVPYIYSWDNPTDRQWIKQIAKEIPVTLIHPGKTGGGSVKRALMKIFPDFYQIHVIGPFGHSLKNRTVIMSIRDPLHRFESAYKWSKYRGIQWMKDSPYNIQWKIYNKIWKCFSNLSILGEHCLDDTECAKVLQHELWSNETTYHLGMGIRYYLKRIHLRKNQGIQLIESERMEMDFKNVVSNILGIRVNITMPQTHSTYPGKDDYIPEEYYENVRELLKEEYRVYHEVKQKYGVSNN